MNAYKYTAVDATGRKVSGVMEGFNDLDATAKIKERFGIVVSLKEIKGAGEKNLLTMELGGNRLNSKAFVMMCSQFATILKAGIPIARAVFLIADKTTDKPLKRMLRNVAADVEAGRTLSASFEDEGGKLLPPTFCETLRAGEESGSLANSFESIYKHFDKQAKMSGRVRSAMAYPLFVLAVAVVVVIVLMIFVIPTFVDMIADMGGETPLLMRILIGASNFFRHWTWLLVIAVAAIVLGIKLYQRTEKGALKLGKLMLRLPVLGNINVLNAASQFANTMATMIQSGLPMPKSVSITGKVISNSYIKKQVLHMSGRIEEGYTVSETMRQAACFPDILTDMVGVGEETGEMGSTLETVAAYYDNELEQAIQSAVAKLEPAMLIFIAFIAGFIVLAVYGSMFSMYSLM